MNDNINRINYYSSIGLYCSLELWPMHMSFIREIMDKVIRNSLVLECCSAAKSLFAVFSGDKEHFCGRSFKIIND